MLPDSTHRFIEIGVVGRPHGIRGKIRVRLFNPESSLINRLPEIYLQKEKTLTRFVIRNVATTSRFCLLTLDDVTSRDEALEWVGATLCIEREALPELEEDEFYVADLIGIEAWDDACCLGRIVASRAAGDIEVVTIVGQGQELDVPLVEEYVVAVDIAGGRLVLKNSDRLPRCKASGKD